MDGSAIEYRRSDNIFEKIHKLQPPPHHSCMSATEYFQSFSVHRYVRNKKFITGAVQEIRFIQLLVIFQLVSLQLGMCSVNTF